MSLLDILALTVLIAVPIALVAWRGTARRRRVRLAARPFPPAWRRILDDGYRLYSRLPPPLRESLERHVAVFIHEQRFEGCGGFVMTEEAKVLIAAQACTLVLNRAPGAFAGVGSILVYPRGFRVPVSEEIGDGIEVESEDRHLGESWRRGEVVLSWRDAEAGAAGRSDANLVFHEFAHQLDQLGDGGPAFGDRETLARWIGVMESEFRRLRRSAHTGARTDLDPYGAEDAAEFFAVVTETFFQAPVRLRKRHSDLYDVLRAYYGVEPAEWR